MFKFNRPSLTALATLCAVLCGIPAMTACDDSKDSNDSMPRDSIVGEWESETYHCDGIGEYHDNNLLEIDSDMEGEGTIFFAVPVEGSVDCSFAEFDIEVSARSDPGEFEVEFDCVDTNSLVFTCGDLDFEADCEVDGDDLECEGDGPWDGYELVFERD